MLLRRRKRIGDCRHTVNGEDAERLVVCVKVDFNAQNLHLFRVQDALMQAIQVQDAKFVVLAFVAVPPI